jgi:hypothetical protein
MRSGSTLRSRRVGKTAHNLTSARALGLSNVHPQRINTKRYQGKTSARQDRRVLVDAPCSGARHVAPAIPTGRQTPHIRGTKQADVHTRRGKYSVKPGGRLVYGTCSFLRRERAIVGRSSPTIWVRAGRCTGRSGATNQAVHQSAERTYSTSTVQTGSLGGTRTGQLNYAICGGPPHGGSDQPFRHCTIDQPAPRTAPASRFSPLRRRHAPTFEAMGK